MNLFDAVVSLLGPALRALWTRAIRGEPGGRAGPPGPWLVAFLLLPALLGIESVLAGPIPDGPDGTVYAVARGADGTTYVGGDFTYWGPQTGGGAALDATTAALDRIFPPVNGRIYAVAPDGAGGWYIGGTFSQVGSQPRRNLAHIDSSGTVTAWDPNAASTVYALVVSGGTVYVGGTFTTIGGITRNRLAAIGADGTLADWNPNANNIVRALAVNGGTVYVGGDFTTLGTTARNYLAAIGTDGTLADWNPNPSNITYTLAVSESTVYVSGNFTTIGGASRRYLAAIGTDGTLVEDWNPNPYGPGGTMVNAMAVSGDTVYVGGLFSTINGETRNGLAAIGTDGTLLSWNPTANARVDSLAVSGNTVYAGGVFTAIGGTTRNRLAAIGTDGTLLSWNPNASNGVDTLAVSGGTVYAGGVFTTIGGTPRNNLAAIGTDGTLLSWDPNANQTVHALAVGGSTVYAGGVFTAVGETTRNRLAAISADGNLSPTWNPNANQTVYALAVSGDTVYAGGQFSNIDGTPRSRLAAIGADGTLTNWNPNPNGTVEALAVSGDTVYAGGQFSNIDGTPRSRLAAIGTDGMLSSWNPNDVGGNVYHVYALAASGDTVYVGGSFTAIGGISRRDLAAIGTDGTLLSWDPSANNYVRALAASGSTVYAGGQFTIIGGAPRNGLAAIGADGTLAAWNPDAGIYVYALAASGGTVAAGGSFFYLAGERISGSPRGYLALLPTANVCGDGFSPSAGPGAPWQTLALPCAPATPATLQNTLGNAPVANFQAGTYKTDWVLYTNNAETDDYDQTPLGDPVGPGIGYWLRSFEVPINGLLTLTGSATPVATGGTGCPSAAGCYVIPLTVAANRYHLIGNPLPYDLDWAQARLLVNDATAYSPSAAKAAKYLDNTFWLWNSTNSGYDSCNDVTPGMTCPVPLYKAFWIKVLPEGAVDPMPTSLKLLIPARSTTIGQTAPATPKALAARPRADHPGWLAWLDWLIPPAAADERPSDSSATPRAAQPNREWYVRLIVEDPATGAQDRNTVLGQLLRAQVGYDPNDLVELSPFATPYLTLLFPHPDWKIKGDRPPRGRPRAGNFDPGDPPSRGSAHRDWQDKSGDYASDFRPARGNQPMTWNLELRADPAPAEVILRWEGPADILRRSRLTDTLTGQTINPASPGSASGLPVHLTGTVRRFTWRYLGGR